MPVITPQFVFMVLGIVSFVVAGILAVLAALYFFRQDIRGVMDDLSGRTRQRDVQGGARTSRGSRVRRASRATAGAGASGAPRADEAVVREAPGAVAQPAEDELDTVLDTKLRRVPQDYADINSDGSDVNDDMPTLVTSVGDYHQDNEAETSMGDADAPTVVDGVDDDMPTEVDNSTGDGSSPFVVTKSIVAIHSNEIITAG